jgi:hypothetical protein
LVCTVFSLVVVVINSIVVDVEVYGIRDSVVVMVIDVGVRVAVLSFLSVVDSVTVIIAV